MLDFFKNQRSTASPSPDLNSGGQFSLFGIVGHVVGLLIVLVMVAGARAKLLPAIENVNAAAQSELDAARNAATSMERDVNAIVDERTTISRVALELQNERNQLAALVAAAEQDLAARRAALDVQSRQQYDSDRDLALAKMDLEKLANQRAQSVVETKTVATKIDSYPTPLSKTVDGKECHFQLKNGRISPIPLEALLKKFRTVASEKAWRLSENNNEMTDTIGPINGFNMRYTLVRVDIQEPGRSGSLIQLDHWEIIPVSSQLGETLDVALGNRSLFRATLDTISARDWTVTVWVYPDSFAEFRRIRKELYLLGFATAGRPLPPDSPIGGSPTGSKSAAQ